MEERIFKMTTHGFYTKVLYRAASMVFLLPSWDALISSSLDEVEGWRENIHKENVELGLGFTGPGIGSFRRGKKEIWTIETDTSRRIITLSREVNSLDDHFDHLEIDFGPEGSREAAGRVVGAYRVALREVGDLGSLEALQSVRISSIECEDWDLTDWDLPSYVPVLREA